MSYNNITVLYMFYIFDFPLLYPITLCILRGSARSSYLWNSHKKRRWYSFYALRLPGSRKCKTAQKKTYKLLGYFKSDSDMKNCDTRLVSERLRKYVDRAVVR